MNHPIDNIEWVEANLLQANSYNPNHVFDAEMELLAHSLIMQGWIGLNYKSAAVQAGVKEKTFNRWVEKAKASKGGIYGDLMGQLEAAVEDSKAFHLNNLHICSQGEEYEETRVEYDATGKILKKEVSKVSTVSEARPKNITPPILIFPLIWPQFGLTVQ